jgi:hypothetical protein
MIKKEWAKLSDKWLLARAKIEGGGPRRKLPFEEVFAAKSSVDIFSKLMKGCVIFDDGKSCAANVFQNNNKNFELVLVFRFRGITKSCKIHVKKTRRRFGVIILRRPKLKSDQDQNKKLEVRKIQLEFLK